MSAIEGLQVATPVFSSWVVPITVVILVGLFVIQRHGTHRVGRTLRSRDGVVVFHDRRPRVPMDRSGARGTRRLRPPACVQVLRRARMARLRGAGRRRSRGDRRRGTLCRHGALRTLPDPRCMVRARAAGTLDQLLRPGGAAARQRRGRHAAVLHDGAVLGTAAARRACRPSPRSSRRRP